MTMIPVVLLLVVLELAGVWFRGANRDGGCASQCVEPPRGMERQDSV